MKTYTHRDGSGMLWRFEGSRPVSLLADRVMAQVARDLAKTRPRCKKPRRGQRRRKAARSG